MISLRERKNLTLLLASFYFYNFNRWSEKYEPLLYLYGESNGVIWDISVNFSYPYNKLYVVGAFDTVTRTSQVQFCSVAEWDGLSFAKVLQLTNNIVKLALIKYQCQTAF